MVFEGLGCWGKQEPFSSSSSFSMAPVVGGSLVTRAPAASLPHPKGRPSPSRGKKASSFALHKRSVAILRPLPPSLHRGRKRKGGWESEGGMKGPRRDWPDASPPPFSSPFIIIEARHLFFLPRFPPHTSRIPPSPSLALSFPSAAFAFREGDGERL